MKDILNRLYRQEHLSRSEACEVLTQIAQAAYNPIQVTSFVTVFNMRPISIEELLGFRDALLNLAIPFDVSGQKTIDIVGTGGDGKNTFNVSTLSAFLLAGAGYKVTKHGSYGVSSSVGSSDVLSALGYEFTTDSDVLKKQLDAYNICFLHAPLFHPALKEVVPIRKQLSVKTFFNIMGPLVNPVQPTHQVLGVVNQEVGRLYHFVMQATGKHYKIIHSIDGYDEISLTGKFKIFDHEGEAIWEPGELGLPTVSPSALFGGNTKEEAAEIFLRILNNEAGEAQKAVVIANAGMGIHCIKPLSKITDCLLEARESLESGRARQVLKNITN